MTLEQSIIFNLQSGVPSTLFPPICIIERGSQLNTCVKINYQLLFYKIIYISTLFYGEIHVSKLTINYCFIKSQILIFYFMVIQIKLSLIVLCDNIRTFSQTCKNILNPSQGQRVKFAYGTKNTLGNIIQDCTHIYTSCMTCLYTNPKQLLSQSSQVSLYLFLWLS